MVRGTTGAPRNATRNATCNTTSSTVAAEASEQGVLGAAPDGVRGVLGRLARIVCGRRAKYLVVAFWILVIAATGSFAEKLQGAEGNDTSAFFNGIDSTLLCATLAVVIVLLLLTCRRLIAMVTLLPALLVVFGVRKWWPSSLSRARAGAR